MLRYINTLWNRVQEGNEIESIFFDDVENFCDKTCNHFGFWILNPVWQLFADKQEYIDLP